eukprot:symbB.v1.2.014470.t1/scaffold1055.1/size140776/12
MFRAFRGQAPEETAPQRLQRLEAEESAVSAQVAEAAREETRAHSECQRLRSALAKAEEDQASAWQSKLAQEREASAVEPASIVYVSVLSEILKAAEEESLDRSISELESEVRALRVEHEQALETSKLKMEEESAEECEMELHHRHRDLKAKLQAGDVEEEQLVKSCGQLRQVLQRLEEEAVTVAQEADDAVSDNGDLEMASESIEHDKLQEAWRLQLELMNTKEEVRALRHQLAKVKSNELSPESSRGTATSSNSSHWQSYQVFPKPQLILENETNTERRAPKAQSRALARNGQKDGRLMVVGHSVVVEELRRYLEMAESRREQGHTPQLEVALQESRAQLRVSLQQQLQSSQEMLQSLRVGILEAEKQLEIELQNRKELEKHESIAYTCKHWEFHVGHGQLPWTQP